MGALCLCQCIKTNPETNFFETSTEIFMRQNLFKVLLVHISLENDISLARALIVINFTLTFYIEICKIPRLFSSPIFLRSTPGVFLRTNLWRPILRLFWDQSFVTDSNTFFRPNIFEREPFFRLETESFFWDQNSQRNEKSLDIEKSWDEMSHSGVHVLSNQT